jgi:hypothetical protein
MGEEDHPCLGEFLSAILTFEGELPIQEVHFLPQQ